ncbi:DUF5988 family protein [Micromonospora sp. RTGN7]|uniref:DUF5988 family protein n=1 Tax=Micromonospora sp. RTGN7 TaxID=3016526 RepID=UPI0029FF520D|nr:DUF5988 family protein [Micromonospora sp. RTGN7]
MTVSDPAPTLSTAGPIVNGDDRFARPVPARTISDEAASIIDVVLEGGPVNLPGDLRSRQVSPVEHKIKVRHYGGYEHFERDISGVTGEVPVVFHWTGRTRIAE